MEHKLEARYRVMTRNHIESYKDEGVKETEIEGFLNNKYKAFKHANRLTGGRISGVYKIIINGKDKVIKYSKGSYRVLELKREADSLKYMNDIGYTEVVPTIRHFDTQEDFAYLIQDYIEGESVREKLRTAKSMEERLEIWENVGDVLAKIHILCKANDSEHEWLNEQFRIARINMDNNLIDLEDFNGENPNEVLVWLIKNKPERTNVCLLHGDFRTKNVMIDHAYKTKIIDWGFVDIGDPYYDLAMIDYYFNNDLEREYFYKGYKISQYDKELITYFDRLNWFINV